jgi:ribosomal protein RSM22 (predicted rRNA methylase)
VRNELAAAIAAECEPHRAALRSSVERLIDAYHAEPARPVPPLSSERDVLAYAAYRMPATAAAVASALRAVVAALPAYQPLTHSDVGGGTGAALWAAAATWPSLQRAVVVERSAPMAEVGRRLAARAPAAVTRAATWAAGDILTGALVPPADLVTMTYALGEIPEPERADVLGRLLAAATGVVVVVEPGTPAGYQRVMVARDALIADGWSVAAPCPHDVDCPMRGRDWCHFSTRVARSALHRQLKGGALAYEDEKFSYVAAARGAVAARCAARIVRHPLTRKGLVSLRLCTTDGLRTQPVAKSAGAAYRAARDASWGDCWDPPGAG